MKTVRKVEVPRQAHTSNAKKPNGDWHVSNESLGMGNYYGSGVRNKVGRVRDVFGVSEQSNRNTSKPPRSLA